ncbi:response regulator transcription factor [Flavonifractor plautii]|uniref:response regulator transcription factor n=1 Tax=Flavonifractor plautii TaxID=292800 RepID=UPI00195C2820|nr:response regulator transcription factor [Flavonifractor plautii]MBM6665061.1 response regulator transcription factor [Flavonifractor plautii]
MRILVVEDQQDMNLLIQKVLKRSGYSVDGCFDGQEAEDYLAGTEYDVILLDVMLPKRDGYQLVADLRGKGVDTPVLILTARDSIADRVKGLDLGADDYLVKPFDFDELLARIRVLSRKRVGHKSNQFTVADLTLDVERRQVYRAGQEIRLLPKEFSILECLMRGKGNVLSRRQIEDSIWNYDDTPSSNNVDVYISKLRKKIDGDSPVKLLHTIRGVGWVLRDDGAAALAGQDGKEV